MRVVVLLIAVLGLLVQGGRLAWGATPLGTPDAYDVLYPQDEPPTDAEVFLGKVLFFDPRLSSKKNISCATCHNPDLGLGDGLALSRGAEGVLLARHTPSLYNLAWNVKFFWDGRATSLEQQALMPIESSQEMNMVPEELLPRLRAVPWYREQFAAIYGKEEFTMPEIGRALSAFQRSLVVDDTPFDRHIAGQENALGPAARRGLALFAGKAECVQCHDGPNFTDESFHNLGQADNGDAGRGGVINEASLHGAFKTPGLRNVALSAPYMHDGSIGTLQEVVLFYNRGGGPAAGKSRLIRPLNLSDQEVADLVAFMGALTQEVRIERPAIPASDP